MKVDEGFRQKEKERAFYELYRSDEGGRRFPTKRKKSARFTNFIAPMKVDEGFRQKEKERAFYELYCSDEGGRRFPTKGKRARVLRTLLLR